MPTTDDRSTERRATVKDVRLNGRMTEVSSNFVEHRMLLLLRWRRGFLKENAVSFWSNDGRQRTRVARGTQHNRQSIHISAIYTS
jgi:hypothetical protein